MKNEYNVEKTRIGTETTHPAYGTILFNRSHGSWKRPLFGSSIEHNNVITMEVRHASIERGLNNDWISGEKPIVEIEMSYSQFAEAITSFGQGSGIPCTIRYTEKDGKIPECDFISKRKQFEDEFKEKRDEAFAESQQLIQDVADLFSQKKNIGKVDRENIIKKLQSLSREIGSNMDFVYNQFNEQMDKTVMEAKGEIEAFCQNKITSIANAAIMEHREEFLKLENPVDIEE